MEKIISCKEYNNLLNISNMREMESLSKKAMQVLSEHGKEYSGEIIRENFPAYISELVKPHCIVVKFPTYQIDISYCEYMVNEGSVTAILNEFANEISVFKNDAYNSLIIGNNRTLIGNSYVIRCMCDTLEENEAIKNELCDRFHAIHVSSQVTVNLLFKYLT